MANPFVTIDASSTVSAATDNLPLLQEYAWDFQNDRFLLDTRGHHVTVTENEALKVWIYKALKTQRYRYECYRHGELDIDAPYGVDLEEYIGKYPNTIATAQLIIRDIKSCLALNPYIKRVISVEIAERKKDKLVIEIELESIYGADSTSVTI